MERKSTDAYEIARQAMARAAEGGGSTVKRRSGTATLRGTTSATADAVEPGKWALSFRVPAQLRTQMEEAAARFGRSLSAEAEARLIESFRVQEYLREAIRLTCGEG